MEVAVFGAAGWVGRAILASLAGRHGVRAFDLSPASWDALEDVDGEWQDGEKIYGDISDYDAVDQALDGVDAVVHAAVHFADAGGPCAADDEKPFLVNLKGMWNVLDSAQKRGVRRIVHVGSCQVAHPDGVFFSSEVRRPDGSLYAVTKRLQEEMCRQYHEAHGLSIVVLRPAAIVDARLGTGQHGDPLKGKWSSSWVCRHSLAEACRLALEKDGIELEVLHTVDTPEAEQTCNVLRSIEVLGQDYRTDLTQYR